MDLVQIRWQQIRLAEASQAIARENLQLKQKIAQIQLNNVSSAKKNQTSGADPEVIKNVKEVVKEFGKDYRKRIRDIKSDLSTQLQTQVNFHETISAISTRYSAVVAVKDAELDSIRVDNAALKKEILQLRQSLNDRTSNQEGEYEMFERKIERLKKENDSLRTAKESTERELTLKKDENASLQSKCVQLQSALQSAEASNVVLRNSIAGLEDESRRSLLLAEEMRQKLTLDYEKMIEEMSIDNRYLRNTIGELEEQIAKLSNAMIGNKSHFAKYVEVKTENVILQSKLENMAGSKGKHIGAAVLPLLNNGTSSPAAPGSARRGTFTGSEFPGQIGSGSNKAGGKVPSLPLSGKLSPRANGSFNSQPHGIAVSSSGKHVTETHSGLILSARSHEHLDTAESAASIQQHGRSNQMGAKPSGANRHHHHHSHPHPPSQVPSSGPHDKLLI